MSRVTSVLLAFFATALALWISPAGAHDGPHAAPTHAVAPARASAGDATLAFAMAPEHDLARGGFRHRFFSMSRQRRETVLLPGRWLRRLVRASADRSARRCDRLSCVHVGAAGWRRPSGRCHLSPPGRVGGIPGPSGNRVVHSEAAVFTAAFHAGFRQGRRQCGQHPRRIGCHRAMRPSPQHLQCCLSRVPP